MTKKLLISILTITFGAVGYANAMANPASIKCVADGWTSTIQTNADGSQYGVCTFPTGKVCEERSYFKWECLATYATWAILPSTTGESYATWAILPTNVISSLEWAYTQGITKFNTMKDFNWDKSLTREQAAKMFIAFAKTLNDDSAMKYDTKAACGFSDLNQADKTLQSHITEACKYGLFKGSKGKYMPTDKITIEQTVIVLKRILGDKYSSLEENINIFFGPALKNITQPITRQVLIDLMKTVYDANSDIEIVGADRDPMWCINSAGYIWSSVKKECIRPFELTVILLSADGTQQYGVAFSADNKQAEIYRGGTDKPSLLLQDITNPSKYIAAENEVLQKNSDGKWVYTYSQNIFLQK